MLKVKVKINDSGTRIVWVKLKYIAEHVLFWEGHINLLRKAN